MEKDIGFIRKITLRSARNWFATYAKQLAFRKEERTTLGRWKPGSNVPDRYDRSVCATELSLRDKIATRIEKGWRPALPYEIPTRGKEVTREMADSSAESTSGSSAISEIVRKREDISDIYGGDPAKPKKK